MSLRSPMPTPGPGPAESHRRARKTEPPPDLAGHGQIPRVQTCESVGNVEALRNPRNFGAVGAPREHQRKVDSDKFEVEIRNRRGAAAAAALLQSIPGPGDTLMSRWCPCSGY
jgi:hypothetical protein